MRRAISLLAITAVSLSSFSSVYAQDEVLTGTTDSATEVTTTSTTEEKTSTTEENSTLNAAPNTTVATTASSVTSAGEYKEVACSTDAIFGQNSCDQCFEGRAVKVGERLSGLSDSWTNNTSNYLIAVKDEQKTPNMVSFDSTWTPTSADESKMWKSSPQISWIPGTNGKEEFQLLPGSKVTFYETDLGAGFTLASSNKKNGDTIGLLRFPVVYYTMDMATVTRSSSATTHYECVKYTLDAPKAPETPKETPKKPVTPEQTKTETGPTETLILIVAAFFIAFGLMISLRKRN